MVVPTRRWAAVACSMLAVAGVLPAGAAAATEGGPGSTTLATRSLMPWHVAPSLMRLRAEVNARWPYRSRISDGTIGDLRHQSRTNSHNPVGGPGGPLFGTRGAVQGMDITAAGIDPSVVLRATVGDPRVWYVIFNGQIWSRTTGWAPRRQYGDPHTTHIHVSLRSDSQAAAVWAELSTAAWLPRAARTQAAPAGRVSTARVSLPVATTRALQRALIARGFRIPSGPTGWYGPETRRAVAAFQRSQGWWGSGADGVAGAMTLARLGVRAPAATPVARPRPRPAVARRPAARPAAARVPAASAYRPGTASPAVYALQVALARAGFPIPAGPTGYFGARTVEAVRAFQRSQGWSGAQADGIPGPATLRRLGLA